MEQITRESGQGGLHRTEMGIMTSIERSFEASGIASATNSADTAVAGHLPRPTSVA